MSLCFLSLPLLYLSAPLYRKKSLKEKSPIPLLSFCLKFTSVNSNLPLFLYIKTVLIKITSKSYAKHRSVFPLMFLGLSAYLAGSLLPPPYRSLFAWLRLGTPHFGAPSCIRVASVLYSVSCSPLHVSWCWGSQGSACGPVFFPCLSHFLHWPYSVSLFCISIHWQNPTLYPKSGPIPKMLSCASSYLFSTCMWISIRYLTFNISKVNCSCFSLVLISFSVVLINHDSILRVAQAKKSKHHHWLLPFSHTLIQTVSKFYCHCLRNTWRIWPLLTRLVVAIHNLLEFCDRVHVEAPSFTPGTYTLFLMQQLKWSFASLLQILQWFSSQNKH